MNKKFMPKAKALNLKRAYMWKFAYQSDYINGL